MPILILFRVSAFVSDNPRFRIRFRILLLHPDAVTILALWLKDLKSRRGAGSRTSEEQKLGGCLSLARRG